MTLSWPLLSHALYIMELINGYRLCAAAAAAVCWCVSESYVPLTQYMSRCVYLWGVLHTMSWACEKGWEARATCVVGWRWRYGEGSWCWITLAWWLKAHTAYSRHWRRDVEADQRQILSSCSDEAKRCFPFAGGLDGRGRLYQLRGRGWR